MGPERERKRELANDVHILSMIVPRVFHVIPDIHVCFHHRRLMKAQLKVAEEAAGKAAQLRAEAAEFRSVFTRETSSFSWERSVQIHRIVDI